MGHSRRFTIASIVGLGAASGSGFFVLSIKYRLSRDFDASVSIVKAHRAASGAKGGEQNQAIGISRGGRSTNIHAIVDSKGRPLNFTVTGGRVHDSQVVGAVLNTPRPPLAVTADKAYDSEKVRQQIKEPPAILSHELSQALLSRLIAFRITDG
jgi:Transposase DDE domain